MKCANKICRFRTERNDCVGAPVTPGECRLYEPQTLTTQKTPVSEVPCSDGLVALQFNNCLETAIKALTYIANYDKPIGGQQNYNAEHLLQIVDELKRVLKEMSN